MKKFEFDTQICTTREQSQRLLSLGLKKETADMQLVYSDSFEDGVLILPCPPDEEGDIPAWSLHRLLCLYNFHYLEFMGEKEIASAYDVVIEAIESAITGGYFNEKYLE